MVKILILQFLDFSNSFAHAAKVAPVVITSSINKICLSLKKEGFCNKNVVSKFLKRSKRALKVWVLLDDILAKLFSIKGICK
jgi:hypothetical protein